MDACCDATVREHTEKVLATQRLRPFVRITDLQEDGQAKASRTWQQFVHQHCETHEHGMEELSACVESGWESEKEKLPSYMDELQTRQVHDAWLRANFFSLVERVMASGAEFRAAGPEKASKGKADVGGSDGQHAGGLGEMLVELPQRAEACQKRPGNADMGADSSGTPQKVPRRMVRRESHEGDVVFCTVADLHLGTAGSVGEAWLGGMADPMA